LALHQGFLEPSPEPLHQSLPDLLREPFITFATAAEPVQHA
jgi:hypothetical protein